MEFDTVDLIRHDAEGIMGSRSTSKGDKVYLVCEEVKITGDGTAIQSDRNIQILSWNIIDLLTLMAFCEDTWFM
jgi:hypothetical protein